jgi:hypothetical protein
MTRSVIWHCTEDNRHHSAIFSGNPDEGFRLRTVCGKVTDAILLTEIAADGEITCPACRCEERLAALSKLVAA